MKKELLLAGLVWITSSCASDYYWPGIGLYGGARQLDDSYEPVDRAAVGGVAFEWKAKTGGLGWELGGFYSEDSETDTASMIDTEEKLKTAEGFVGIRADFGHGENRLRPYIGGGFAYVWSESSLAGPSPVEADDSSPAGYGHAGLMFQLTESLGIGFDVRGLFGSDVDLGPGSSTDVDYVQGTIALALRF